MCWNWVVTDPTCGDYSYKSRQKFEGQPLWPPLSPSHKPWKPTWVHSHSAFSTDLLQFPRGLLNVKKLLKRISSLCQKECANLFLYQQLKVHFFLWGVCVCIRVCVRVRHRTDLSPGGWLSCFRVYQLPTAKIKVTLRVYFLQNVTTGKVVNGIIFWTLGFFYSLIFPTSYLWKDYTTTTTREGSATDLEFSVMFVIKTKALVWDFHVMFFKNILC